jgi:DNA polymerase-3 subunit epsilon
MSDAISGERAWQLLLEAAAATAEDGRLPATCVAHYARFEKQFLEDLHQEYAPRSRFPLRFVCTLEIARRLFPDLPRRGLRALAGFLGGSLPELKRAGSHVQATAVVWASLIKLLRTERGIETLEELSSFLDTAAPSRGPRWTYPLPREKRLALPDVPGVYRMLGGDGNVLYVGKAGSLRTRVNSYFRKRRGEDRLLELVSQVHDLEVTPTVSSLEAALLEVEEIRRCDPAYNRALRDGGRDLWFFTRDLESCRTGPDGQHTVGPVPIKEVLEGISVLWRQLHTTCSREDLETTLSGAIGLPGEAREAGLVREAVNELIQRHAFPEARDGTPALLRLGARLWMDRLEDPGRGEEDLAEEDEGAPASDEVDEELGPQGIADRLEDLLIHASRLVRRARWLCRLTESTLRWKAAGEERDRWRILRIGRGSLRAATWTADPAERPTPPGWERRFAKRQMLFDATMYTRLRVLTTELRRLLAQDRTLDVTLGPQLHLDGVTLRRFLALL